MDRIFRGTLAFSHSLAGNFRSYLEERSAICFGLRLVCVFWLGARICSKSWRLGVGCVARISCQNTAEPGNASNFNMQNLKSCRRCRHEICCTLFKPKTEELRAAKCRKPRRFQANENTSLEDYYIERFMFSSVPCFANRYIRLIVARSITLVIQQPR